MASKSIKLSFSLDNTQDEIARAIVKAVVLECTGVDIDKEGNVTVRMDPDYDRDTFDIVIDWGVEES